MAAGTVAQAESHAEDPGPGSAQSPGPAAAPGVRVRLSEPVSSVTVTARRAALAGCCPCLAPPPANFSRVKLKHGPGGGGREPAPGPARHGHVPVGLGPWRAAGETRDFDHASDRARVSADPSTVTQSVAGRRPPGPAAGPGPPRARRRLGGTGTIMT